jgi:hypothetical protein
MAESVTIELIIDASKAVEAIKAMRREAAEPQGCICPPGAEATCQGPLCPRRSVAIVGRQDGRG